MALPKSLLVVVLCSVEGRTFSTLAYSDSVGWEDIDKRDISAPALMFGGYAERGEKKPCVGRRTMSGSRALDWAGVNMCPGKTHRWRSKRDGRAGGSVTEKDGGTRIKAILG